MMMNQNELVSIIIPTYSRNDTLIRAIESARAQTYSNIEIIVIDDNSSDSEWRKKTILLMRRYSSDNRIHYICNKKNLGGAGARNEGIKKANGNYIAFLDDDDEYLPDNIKMKMEVFHASEDGQLALVYGFSEYLNKGKAVYVNCNNYNGCCLYEAMRENCIAATSQWIVKREVLLDIGMFPIVPSKQDSQLLLRLLQNGYEIKCIPKVLTRYYMDFDEYKHISTNGRKPLEGELLYRNECRKTYKLFTTKQVSNIEYTFARMLFEKYTDLRDTDNANKEKMRMYKLDSKKAIVYFSRRMLRKLKGYLING